MIFVGRLRPAVSLSIQNSIGLIADRRSADRRFADRRFADRRSSQDQLRIRVSD
jgi:hypothetical protein